MLIAGVYPQIYRDAVPGHTAQDRVGKLAEYCELAVTLRAPGVAFHGFPRELGERWPSLASLALSRGLNALAAWGLDGERDTDGTRLTGFEKGGLVGAVLAQDSCAAGLLDAEGRWDDADRDRPGDPTSKAHAIELGVALREKAPRALVGDQPWFAIDSHGEVRAQPVLADPEDVFSGFPVDEFARHAVNWMRFRQAYCNEAGFTARWGTQRYERVFAWMDRDWTRVQAALARAGLERPLSVTIQAYGWGDAPQDLVHCLLTYTVQLNRPVIVWCNPSMAAGKLMPDATVAAIMAVNALRDLGFACAGVSPVDVVKAYQQDFNRTASEATRLTVDGQCGRRTLGTLGFRL